MENGHESLSLETVARELARNMLDSLGVQKVRWDKSCTEPADYTYILVEMGIIDVTYGLGFFPTQRNHSR
jgi:hypothetical protein